MIRRYIYVCRECEEQIESSERLKFCPHCRSPHIFRDYKAEAVTPTYHPTKGK